MAKYICLLIILVAAVVAASAASAPVQKKREYSPSLMLQYNWPEPDQDITQFPHESSCHHYYLILSEDDISVEKCPDDQVFDYFLHQCADKQLSRCWSRHFGKLAHKLHYKIKKPFRCPFAWGKYPDVEDCTMYYACLSGEAKHKRCAPFEHFDKISRKCVAEIEGVCADETDVIEHGYKCPHPWGSFVFSRHCAKYYECLQKRPTLRSCQVGMLFDKRLRKCVLKENVQCGSRYNPYEPIVNDGNTETTEIPTTFSEVKSTSAPSTVGIEISEQPTANTDGSTEVRVTEVEVTQSPTVSPSTSTKVSSSSRSDDNTSPSTGSTKTVPSDLKTEETDPTVKEIIGVSSVPTTGKLIGVSSDPTTGEFIDVSSVPTANRAETFSTTLKGADEVHTESVVEGSSTHSSQEEVTTKSTKGLERGPSPDLSTPDPELQCAPGTCSVDPDGSVLRCPVSEGLHPHPRNEKRFLRCRNFQLEVLQCPDSKIFDVGTKRCKWNFVM